MYVIPAEGRKVPDLDLRDHLPVLGRNVMDSDYWVRRLLDGDVQNSPEALTDALTQAMKLRDEAKVAREAAKAARANVAPEAIEAVGLANAAVLAAESDLAVAEARVSEITRHAPHPAKAASRAAAAPSVKE